jgi:hypothetical protein
MAGMKDHYEGLLKEFDKENGKLRWIEELQDENKKKDEGMKCLHSFMGVLGEHCRDRDQLEESNERHIHAAVNYDYIVYCVKGVYCMRIKLYNQLPIDIKNSVNNQKIFGSALKNFLHSNSFYTLEEFYNYNCKML